MVLQRKNLTDIRLPDSVSSTALGLVTAMNNISETTILKHLFDYLGWINLLCFAFALTKSRQKKTLVPMFHVLPLLIYNFGTAILLSGYDWRFFFFSLIAFFPILLLLLAEGSAVKSAEDIFAGSDQPVAIE